MSHEERWDAAAKDKIVQWMVETMASIDDHRTIVFGSVRNNGEVQTTWAMSKSGGSADAMGLVSCLETDLKRRWNELERPS